MNPFDQMYEGRPPWDIGRPQDVIVRLARRGRLAGRVLDLGCGTGDAVSFLAASGRDAWGVDASPRAIAMARAKASRDGSDARFLVGDALELEGLDLPAPFDTAIDCGLFHTLPDGARGLYAQSLSSVMRPGAMLYLLCFSDKEPDWGGPRRVRKDEIREAFRGTWHVDRVEQTRFESLVQPDGARAWLATITHIGRVVSRGN